MRIKQKRAQLGEHYFRERTWVDDVKFWFAVILITGVFVCLLDVVINTMARSSSYTVEAIGTFISKVI